MELTREEEMHSVYSDMYKDAYGIRPLVKTPDFFSWSDEEFEKEMHYLEGIIIEELEAEAKRQRASSKAFWDRMKKMCLNFSIDILTAIRWDMQAEGEGDLEHHLWANDLSWDEIQEVVDNMGNALREAA